MGLPARSPGFIVGMTGLGGGALMTPILVLLFGTAPLAAVGTDLRFAAITKVAVSVLHLRKGLIDWPVAGRLWAGSLPAAVLTIVGIGATRADAAAAQFVKTAIGLAVCLTAIGLPSGRVQARFRQRGAAPAGGAPRGSQGVATVAAGAFVGMLVTLTSVGAGALGAVMLLYLYPSRLTPSRLVATDIAHAIPLALVAGVGHLGISHVDGLLLRDLLTGAIPAALAGALLSSRVPHAALRAALGTVLLMVGVTTIAAA
jgi:uncharacterized membrane protein YfcA